MIEAALQQALEAVAHAAALSEKRHRFEYGRGVPSAEIGGTAPTPE
jgi:hypothetical protein